MLTLSPSKFFALRTTPRLLSLASSAQEPCDVPEENSVSVVRYELGSLLSGKASSRLEIIAMAGISPTRSCNSWW